MNKLSTSLIFISSVKLFSLNPSTFPALLAIQVSRPFTLSALTVPDTSKLLSSPITKAANLA
jgi:hypothetical protein